MRPAFNGPKTVRKNKNAVRVTPKAEAMLANKQTSFFKDYREKDIPASNAPMQLLTLWSGTS